MDMGDDKDRKSIGDRRFHELPIETQKMVIDENGNNIRNLNASVDDWAAKALRFLILINTGGALIVFTQTGALVQKVESISPLYLPAIAFIFGIVLSGIINFYIWHKSDLRLREIRKQNKKFYSEKSTTLAEYANSDDLPNMSIVIIRLMGAASALMFILGVYLGFRALDALKIIEVLPK